MRWTQYFISTLRETPQEAEISSHKLMLRGSFIQKLSSGLYTYQPLGLRVLKKIKAIIREEMANKNAIELLMPILQPKTIWEESGRYAQMGALMMRTFDRNENEFILGPTHEEIITDFVRKRINSYKQLPKNFYQIQNKFRDEVRPRFGLMRAKEFIMKDGYSFDLDEQGADKNYRDMYDAYVNIFSRCGLKIKIVEADTGVMGGNVSHEFMATADSGEDKILECSQCNYAANAELAERIPQAKEYQESLKAITEIHTPEMKKVEDVANFLKTAPDRLIKTLIYLTPEEPIAVLVRGDIDINENKLKKNLKQQELTLADEKTIQNVTGGPVGFSGPVGLKNIKIIADTSIEKMLNSITGSNKNDYHLINVNLDRDFKVDKFFDLGEAQAGDICKKCQAPLQETRGIEVGQVFKLGTKYAQALSATILDENGKEKTMIMGCYGIGISRTAQAVVEQNNDENGIIWPMSIAPFTVVVLPLNTKKPEIIEKAEKIYQELKNNNLDVILDDRHERAGIKFKDSDLIGFPIRIVIGEKNLQEGLIEVSLRKTMEKELIKEEDLLNKVKELIQTEQ